MKKKIIVSLAILVVVLLTSVVTFAFTATNKKMVPSDYHIGVTYEEAMASSEKPTLVLFYADWCGYCLRFMPKYRLINTLYKNKYNFAMVNVENPNYKKLIEDVSLSGYPTVYIVDSKYNNRVLLANSIYHNLGKFRVELDRYLRIRSILDKNS